MSDGADSFLPQQIPAFPESRPELRGSQRSHSKHPQGAIVHRGSREALDPGISKSGFFTRIEEFGKAAKHGRGKEERDHPCLYNAEKWERFAIFNENAYFCLEINDALKEEFLSKKKKLCSSVFRLLKSICLKNDSNKFKIAKYLPIFSMQSFYIPQALECIIAIIENYEDLLYNIHNEVNEPEEQSYLALPSPNQSAEMKKTPLAKASRCQSPSKILRDSKMRQSEMKGFKPAENQDTFKDHAQRSQSYVELYDNFIFSWQEQEEGMKSSQWDLLNFFIMMIFQAELTLSDRKNLLSFLKTSVVKDGNGLNVNQELIFKYLNLNIKRDSNPIFKKMLFRIETTNSSIQITTDDGSSYKLEEAFADFSSSPIAPAQIRNVGEIANKLKLIPLISSASPQISPLSQKPIRGKRPKKSLNTYNSSKYICDQFDFYAMMCNGRNHTWKKFLEESIGLESMINYFDMEISFGNWFYRFNACLN